MQAPSVTAAKVTASRIFCKCRDASLALLAIEHAFLGEDLWFRIARFSSGWIKEGRGVVAAVDEWMLIGKNGPHWVDRSKPSIIGHYLPSFIRLYATIYLCSATPGAKEFVFGGCGSRARSELTIGPVREGVGFRLSVVVERDGIAFGIVGVELTNSSTLLGYDLPVDDCISNGSHDRSI